MVQAETVFQALNYYIFIKYNTCTEGNRAKAPTHTAKATNTTLVTQYPQHLPENMSGLSLCVKENFGRTSLHICFCTKLNFFHFCIHHIPKCVTFSICFHVQQKSSLSDFSVSKIRIHNRILFESPLNKE